MRAPKTLHTHPSVSFGVQDFSPGKLSPDPEAARPQEERAWFQEIERGLPSAPLET